MSRTADRILVLGGDASGRLLTESILRSMGCEVETQVDGLHALARLRSPPPRLVVCDDWLPGGDALELCRAMKAHRDWRFVPFLLVTALHGDDALVRGLDAGADDVIEKPIVPSVLTARVRAAKRTRGRYVELLARAADWDTLLRERLERLAEDAGLSPREREVLHLTLLGRTHVDIALVLGVTVRTSKFHVANVVRKLGAESRMDLVRLLL